MSTTVEYEGCVGCGHNIAKHYSDPTGKVRCMVVKRGVSTRGVQGLPYAIDCPCTNYSVPTEVSDG